MHIWNRFLHQLAGQLKRAENIIRQRIKRQETNQMKKTEKCYTNRELSWLQFNERVLNEAGNPRVPLAERMTFASIYQTNLDEFFMVRVGTLMMQMNAKEKVIENIFEEIMAENFPNLKETDIKILEAQRAPNKLNPNRSTPRHSIIKNVNIFL